MRRALVAVSVVLLVAFAFAVGYAAGRVTATPRPSPEALLPTTTGAPQQTRLETGAPNSPTATSVVIPESDIPLATPSFEGSGIASWYCNSIPERGPLSPCTRGYPDVVGTDAYAAAGPLLRDGDWRGRVVTVFGPVGFEVVTLIDWCACPNKIVDLYADVFEDVCGPLSRGVCLVSVSW